MKELLIGGGIGFLAGAVVMFIYYSVVSKKVAAAETVVQNVKKDV